MKRCIEVIEWRLRQAMAKRGVTNIVEWEDSLRRKGEVRSQESEARSEE